MTACHHLWGGIMGVFPACRHDPAWRNTGLRTASTPAGVEEMSASGHRALLRSAGYGVMGLWWRDDGLPPPPGWHYGGCAAAVPACRRRPGRRNTGLRTAATPAGVGEMSASGHRALLRSAGDRANGWRQPPVRCGAWNDFN